MLTSGRFAVATRTWGAGLLWACGQYWTRTSDLYHVKVALTAELNAQSGRKCTADFAKCKRNDPIQNHRSLFLLLETDG